MVAAALCSAKPAITIGRHLPPVDHPGRARPPHQKRGAELRSVTRGWRSGDVIRPEYGHAPPRGQATLACVSRR